MASMHFYQKLLIMNAGQLFKKNMKLKQQNKNNKHGFFMHAWVTIKFFRITKLTLIPIM